MVKIHVSVWCRKKSELVVVYCGAAQVKQRDCRTCGAGWAGLGGPWSLADALQKIRRTVTGKLEQPRTRNTDRMSGDGGARADIATTSHIIRRHKPLSFSVVTLRHHQATPNQIIRLNSYLQIT